MLPAMRTPCWVVFEIFTRFYWRRHPNKMRKYFIGRLKGLDDVFVRSVNLS